MANYLVNESKHLDLIEWLDTIEDIGVNIADAFPGVIAANERAHRILKIKEKAHQAHTAGRRRLLATINLDDEDAVIVAVDRAAHAQNTEHAANVANLYDNAADELHGDAVRIFRRSDILAILRPRFDEVAARIVEAAETIPYGVMSIGDAARLGHGDTYTQLERDAQTWRAIADLISTLHQAGVLDLGRDYHPFEAMLEDVQAYWDTLASSGRPMRVARAVAAGRPNLHIPTEPHIPYGNTSDQDRWASEDANAAEKTARAALGLTDY
ncbi:hypothetical protein [Microbacterium sp. 1P10AE]|jgi:hypothetical protein|uniref:hypothetical protein n=1 Tax=Microbacterium sp. 1P10AE TaxID=3132286 RepID=UPI0039A30EE9